MNKNKNNKPNLQEAQKTISDAINENFKASDVLNALIESKIKELGNGNQKSGKKHKVSDVTRLYVITQAAQGTTQDLIASALGISDDTLRKYYSVEFEKGKAIANHLVKKALMLNALSGNVRAQEFWLKTQTKDFNTSVDNALIDSAESQKILDSKLLESFGVIQSSSIQNTDTSNNDELVDEIDE